MKKYRIKCQQRECGLTDTEVHLHHHGFHPEVESSDGNPAPFEGMGLCHPGYSPLGGWPGWQPHPFQREAKIRAWFQDWAHWEQKDDSLQSHRWRDSARTIGHSCVTIHRLRGVLRDCTFPCCRLLFVELVLEKRSPGFESSIVASTSLNACNTICSSELLWVTS